MPPLPVLWSPLFQMLTTIEAKKWLHGTHGTLRRSREAIHIKGRKNSTVTLNHIL